MEGHTLLAAWEAWRGGLAACASRGDRPALARDSSSFELAAETLWSLVHSGDAGSDLELWHSVARCAYTSWAACVAAAPARAPPRRAATRLFGWPAPPPHTHLPGLTPSPCSSLPAVLHDVHAVAEAGCRLPRLEKAALAALKPLALLVTLANTTDLPTARELVASEPFVELARFCLRKAPALLRLAASAAGE